MSVIPSAIAFLLIALYVRTSWYFAFSRSRVTNAIWRKRVGAGPRPIAFILLIADIAILDLCDLEDSGGNHLL